MTTAATITANLKLDTSNYQQGLKTATAATKAFESRYQSMVTRLRQSAAVYDGIGAGLSKFGNKMTLFVTTPILLAFVELEKQAMKADTALAKMANSSLAKLNEQLVILGTKLLPLVIIAFEALAKIVEDFNNASPGVQKTITMFVILLALVGPIAKFVGGISSLIAMLLNLKAVVITLIPSIATLGTTIWAALLPILPIIIAIIALVAGLAFVIWAFATDFMGVTTTLKQLFYIIGWSFKQMWEDLKAKTKAGLDWIETNWKKSTEVWADNQKQAQEIQSKLWTIMVNGMTKGFTDFVNKVKMKLTEFRNWATNTWNAVWNGFRNAFSAISNFANSVFQSIVKGIQWVIDAIQDLIAALGDIVIPDDLQPGSPTPFEMGLRGIARAMDNLTRNSLPNLSMAMAPAGVTEVGAGRVINIVDNRRFAAGMDPRSLRMALDERFEGFEKNLFGED